MKQGYGKVYLNGNISNYDSMLQRISDKSLFKITLAIYRVQLYSMSGGDKAEGRINVGEYQSPRITFRVGLSSFEHSINREIDNLYQSGGINAIKPFSFATNWSGDKALQFTLSAETNTAPTVKITGVEGSSVFEKIVLKWASTMQDKFTITATKGNTTKTYTGTTETSYTINATDFIATEGIAEASVKISLKIEYTNNNTLSENSWASEDTSVSLKSTNPQLTELTAINGLLTWKGTNLAGSTAKVELYNIDLNNTKVADFEIPSAELSNNKYFIPGTITLYDGNHLVKMIVSKVINRITYSSQLSTNMQLTNRPYVKVNSLEPANVPRNYEKDIQITWDTTNQQTYNLKVFQNNVLIYEKSGTTEKSLTLQRNTLKDGIATLQLTVTNILYDIVKQDTKTVQFSLYGGLKPPNITTNAVNNVLDKNNIIISWNKTDLQRYYRVEFEVIRIYNLQKLDTNLRMDSGYHFDGEYLTFKEDSGIIRGTETSYTSKSILFKNDNIKNIKVTVYNELKESNSNVYSNDIYVNYVTTANTKITSYTQEDTIIINCKANAVTNATFKLMRGTDENYTQYKEIYSTTQTNFEYKDNNVKSDTRYFYYVITTVDNKSNASNVVTEKIKIKGFLFTNLETNKTKNLNLEVSADFTTTDGKVIVEYLGKPTADIEQDERNYQICNYSCLVHKDDIVEVYKLFDAEKVAYRDRKGNAFICNLTHKKVSYSDKLDDYIKLSFDMIEIDSMKQFE
jgi:hypothetical protein|nr:MAG TPA: hypothetical protein [Caudoviricetes sp.]